MANVMVVDVVVIEIIVNATRNAMVEMQIQIAHANNLRLILHFNFIYFKEIVIK
jgi:hypothetical protein